MKKLALLGLLASVGCGPSVKRIAMEPPTAQLTSKGASVTVRASPKDEKDQAVADVQLTWSSDKADVASVDATGKVTAVKSGKAVITAKAGDVSGTTQVNVSIPASLALAPPEVKLAGIGQTAQVQKTVKDDTGAAITNQIVMFTSSDPNVAAVDNQGNVRSIGAGSAVITARTAALTATTKVTVALPAFDKLEVKPKGPLKLKVGKGDHLTGSATAAGKEVAGVPVKWASDHADIVTVSATGDVNGVKKGKATITATAGDKTEKIAVVVQ
jgi:uncharacterized protein YjdB